MKKFTFIIFTFLIALISGCGINQTRYVIQIDSISGNNNEKTSYFILPADESLSNNSLLFEEFSTYIDKVLTEIGFTKKNSIDEASTIIFLNYGLSDPISKSYTYSRPIFGQTGVTSSTTSGVVSNTGYYSATTNYTPSFGIVGFSNESGTITTYLRFVEIESVDRHAYLVNNQRKQLWKVSISSEGVSNDLRTVFPYLVVAAKDYIGENTRGIIEKEIYESDYRVEALLSQ